MLAEVLPGIRLQLGNVVGATISCPFCKLYYSSGAYMQAQVNAYACPDFLHVHVSPIHLPL
jgi:hypothetical protein